MPVNSLSVSATTNPVRCYAASISRAGRISRSEFKGMLLSRRLSNIAIFALYVAGYAVVLWWLKSADVYHTRFDATGSTVVAYNLARTAFIFYLFWIVTTAGSLALRVTFGKLEHFGALEYLVLSFFVGAGLSHIAMMAAGYLGLYTTPAAISVTLLLVILSWPVVFRTLYRIRRRTPPGSPINSEVKLAAGLLTVSGLLLLMTKGLYPSGGHDYFTHYFPYYLEVIEWGNIWPNSVWYHYYYSKGAGLFFLGILLTDPLAPQLVTFCFVIAAAAALYLMVRAGAPNPAWPLAAAGLFLAAYINTPLWGEFEKQHEINTAFLVGIAWMWARALSTDDRDRQIFHAGTIVSVIGAVIQSNTAAVFLGASFGLMAIWFAIRLKFRQTLLCLGLAAISGAALVAIFAINHATTGLIDDQVILQAWRYSDAEKLYRWGVLFPVILLHWGRTWMEASPAAFFQSASELGRLARAYILFPLIASSLAICGAAIYCKWRNGTWPCAKLASSEINVLSAMLLVAASLGLTVGQAQPISFYRYSSFIIPLFLAFGILIWVQPIATSGSKLGRFILDWRSSFALVSMLVFLIATSAGRKQIFIASSPVLRGLQFLTGAYSIDNAYMHQEITSYPWGAIYPGARGAYSVVGPRTPIWSMNIQAYCMLPRCRVETVHSFTLGRSYPEVIFGSPEAARAALQKSNHNHFLISNRLPLEDFLSKAPLFSPDIIGDFFGIRWTDGDSTLLTWRGPNTKPIDEGWISEYRKKLQNSSGPQSIPYSEMQSIFSRLEATPHPWRSIALPWQRP